MFSAVSLPMQRANSCNFVPFSLAVRMAYVFFPSKGCWGEIFIDAEADQRSGERQEDFGWFRECGPLCLLGQGFCQGRGLPESGGDPAQR